MNTWLLFLPHFARMEVALLQRIRELEYHNSFLTNQTNYLQYQNSILVNQTNQLQYQNSTLTNQTNQLEHNNAILSQQTNQLKSENVILEDRCHNLAAMVQNNNQVQEQADLEPRPQEWRRRTRKRRAAPYDLVKRTSRWRQKQNMKQSINEAILKYDQSIVSAKTDVKLTDGTSLVIWSKGEQEEKNADVTLPQLLLIKDRFRISDDAMHELHMLYKNVPPKNQITAERQRLSTTIPVMTPDNVGDDVAYRNITDLLDFILQMPQHRHILQTDEEEVRITARFATDGARISKLQNSVRGVMKIISPRDSLPSTSSPDDEHTLFLYLGDENYDEMKRWGASTIRDMQTVATEGVIVQEKRVFVEWIVCSDWKALALMKGINAANAKYFCLWCHASKADIKDFDDTTEWPIERSNNTRHECLGKPKKDRKGYKDEELLSFIPFSSVLPDELHLRIRIATKLFNQVVTWAIDDKKTAELKAEMKRIRVAFELRDERGDDGRGSVTKWGQLNGDDLHTIMHQMKVTNVLERRSDKRLTNLDSLTIAELKDELRIRGLDIKGKKADLIDRLKDHLGSSQLPRRQPRRSRILVESESDDDEDEDNVLDPFAIEQLWRDFNILMASLKAKPDDDAYKSPLQFGKDAKLWARQFRKVTFDEDVTPYIHAMVYHVHDFLEKYKSIIDIGTAQVERKNFDQREAYFGATSRAGGKSKKKVCVQILERENRLLYAKDQGLERKKRAYRRRNAED